MKVLLLAINAKYIHTNPAIHALRQYAIQYADYIVQKEFTVNHSLDAILQGVYQERPDLLCISCYLWNIRMVQDLVADYPKLDAKASIYLGGPEVSYDAPECLRKMPEAKGIMAGEGEATFLELVRCYAELHQARQTCQDRGASKGQACHGAAFFSAAQEEAALEKIRGLIFRREDGAIQVNPKREPLDFSRLPFPYQDKRDLRDFRHKIIYYETSRGCPFSCCYCLSSVEKTLRFREWPLVRQELQFFLDQQVEQVKFVDRTFNCNKRHAMAIWQYLRKHDNQVTNFHFEIAADLLDEEEIRLLAQMRPGQVQLEIGIQSTNPKTIAAICRRMDLEKVAAAVGEMKKGKNIHQHLDLIAGLPYEDYASFAKSFNDVYRMSPDQLQLGFLKVLKGSAMAEMTEEHGIKYKSAPPYEVLSTKYLSYQELLRLKDIEEVLEVYYNSRQFLFSLPYLKRWFSSPFAMLEALADYYRRRDLFECKQSRMERYEILFRFFAEAITDEAGEARQCFAELLLLDLYSREKIKSQPSFSEREEERGLLRRVLEAYRIPKKELGHYAARRFSYDLEAAVCKGTAVKSPMLLLFDYRERSPLSGCCKIEICDLAAGLKQGWDGGIL